MLRVCLRRRVVSVILLIMVMLSLLGPMTLFHMSEAKATNYNKNMFKQYLTECVTENGDAFKKHVAECISKGLFKSGSASDQAGYSSATTFLSQIRSGYIADSTSEIKNWLGNYFSKYDLDKSGENKDEWNSFTKWIKTESKYYEKIVVYDSVYKATGIPKKKTYKKVMAQIAWNIGFKNPDATGVTKEKLIDSLVASGYGTKKKLTKVIKYSSNANFLKSLSEGYIKQFIKFGQKVAQMSGIGKTITSNGKKKESTFLVDNPGTILSRKAIFGHMSGFPSTMGDIDYVDVAQPWKTSASKIGGFVSSVGGKKIGSETNREGDFAEKDDALRIKMKTVSGLVDYAVYINKKTARKGKPKVAGGKYEVESKIKLTHIEKTDDSSAKKYKGLTTIVDKSGCRFGLTAIPLFNWKPSLDSKNPQGNPRQLKLPKGASEGTYKFDGKSFNGGEVGSNTGQLLDVILYDGTVWHFIIVDECAADDSNSGKYSKLNYKQYKWVAYHNSCHTLEFLSEKDICPKFNKKTRKGIWYFRLYNANILHPDTYTATSNNFETKMADLKHQGMSGEGVVDENGNDPNKQLDPNGNPINGLNNEKKYVSKTTMNEIVVALADKDTFSSDDLYNVELWKQDVNSTSVQTYIIDGARWVTIMCGILVIVWMIIIYLCFWFDTVNTFIDIEFLPIVTFGRLRRAEIDEDVTWHLKKDTGHTDAKGAKLIDHKRLLLVMLLGITLGCLILTGVLFTWISDILRGLIRWGANLFW